MAHPRPYDICTLSACDAQEGGNDEPERNQLYRITEAGEMRPLKLRSVLHRHGIAAADLSTATTNLVGGHVSRPSIYQCCNRGLIPEKSCPDFRAQVEAFLRSRGVPETEILTIWQRDKTAGVTPIHRLPADQSERILNGLSNKAGDPYAEIIKEAEMLTPTTMKHFKLFRNPFLDDVQNADDVYMSESHNYAHAAMMDAARNGGFVAVCAECGAGKSVMRRKLISELNEAEDCRVIIPETPDKTFLTSSNIQDAIIFDLDPDARIRQSREAKARQVRSALVNSARAGMRHVLIIEEAHDLSTPTMKQLKRLWEIEDGYRKVLGIILIGQQELQTRLNRQTHPEMREVILRCLIATLEALGRADTEAYIDLKFRRVGSGSGEIIGDGCIDATIARLTMRNGFSCCYPLYINNLLAKAMNAAAQVGEPLVTPEIIEGV